MGYCQRNNPLNDIECIEIQKGFKREEKSKTMFIVYYIFMVGAYLVLKLDLFP